MPCKTPRHVGRSRFRMGQHIPLTTQLARGPNRRRTWMSDGPVSTVHRYPTLYCHVAAAGLNLSVFTRNRYVLIAVCLASALL
jgi:hypothetical protein